MPHSLFHQNELVVAPLSLVSYSAVASAAPFHSFNFAIIVHVLFTPVITCHGLCVTGAYVPNIVQFKGHTFIL